LNTTRPLALPLKLTMAAVVFVVCARSDQSPKSSRVSPLDEMLADREERELEAIGDTELAENLGEVMLDGLLAQREALRDLPVAVAGGDRRHDFKLARCQAEFRLHRAEHLRAQRLDQARYAVASNPVFARHHHPHRLHQELRGRFLEHQAARTELQRL